MAKRIFKYPLSTTDVQTLEMPMNAEILCIQMQNHSPCIWAIVNPDEDKIIRTFEIFGTGHQMPEDDRRKYIGTYQLNGGALVFHCFELIDLF